MHLNGGRNSQRGELALPPPGVLSQIDMQEVNRIFVCSDRLNRCSPPVLLVSVVLPGSLKAWFTMQPSCNPW